MTGAATTTKVVTVYAASGANVDQAYKDHAYQLGKEIAEEGWIQVNGGGSTGLMGAATVGGLDAEGKVECVILRTFLEDGLNEKYTSVQIVDTMPERKKGLYDKADAFVALPGGLGTLDELAEVMCLRQLSFHDKPVVLVNTNGFYDSIREFLQNGIKNKFIAEDVSRVIHFAGTPTQAIAVLKTYKAIHISKKAINSSEMNVSSPEPEA